MKLLTIFLLFALPAQAPAPAPPTNLNAITSTSVIDCSSCIVVQEKP